MNCRYVPLPTRNLYSCDVCDGFVFDTLTFENIIRLEIYYISEPRLRKVIARVESFKSVYLVVWYFLTFFFDLFVRRNIMDDGKSFDYMNIFELYTTEPTRKLFRNFRRSSHNVIILFYFKFDIMLASF